MRRRPFFTFWALLIIVMAAMAVQAQSGRRQVKPSPSVPVPTPTPEPTPTPQKEEEKEPELIFLVAIETRSSFNSIPWAFHDAAMQGCAQKLRNASSAVVDVAQRDMSRGEAIKKAKAETKTYVVLLALTFDSMATSYDDMQLDFIVLAPTTAKVVTTGRSYINTNRQGPVVVGPSNRGAGMLYREQWLRQAGEEAASRILKRMNLVVK